MHVREVPQDGNRCVTTRRAGVLVGEGLLCSLTRRVSSNPCQQESTAFDISLHAIRLLTDYGVSTAARTPEGAVRD